MSPPPPLWIASFSWYDYSFVQWLFPCWSVELLLSFLHRSSKCGIHCPIIRLNSSKVIFPSPSVSAVLKISSIWKHKLSIFFWLIIWEIVVYHGPLLCWVRPGDCWGRISIRRCGRRLRYLGQIWKQWGIIGLRIDDLSIIFKRESLVFSHQFVSNCYEPMTC